MSARSTISESLCPIPAVSTRTSPKPCVRRNETAEASIAFVARFCRRVAIERMKTRSLRRLFIRMRSPSSAPPVRRRVGSTATTATRSSREVGQEAGEDLVRHGALAGAAGAGDPDDRHACARAAPLGLAEREVSPERSPRPRAPTASAPRRGRRRRAVSVGNERSSCCAACGALDEVVDHPREAELQPVVRVSRPARRRTPRARPPRPP